MPILIHKIIHRIAQTDSPLQIPYVTSVRIWNEKTVPEEMLSSPKSVISVMKKKTVPLSLSSCSSVDFYSLWFLLLFLPPSLGG